MANSMSLVLMVDRVTTFDQVVVKNGQKLDLLEKWTSDPSIDVKLPDKFICIIFESDLLR